MSGVRAYTYYLLDPHTCEVRYVGITIYPAKRLTQHCVPTAPHRVGRWVRTLDRKPLMVVVDVSDSVEDAERSEAAHITLQRSLGARLTNTTPGGNSSRGGWKQSDDWITAHRARHTGKTMSAEARRKIGEALRGRTHSAQTRSNMAAAHKGVSLSTEHRQAMSQAQSRRWQRERACQA
jgi:hypothetical protein